MDIQTYLSRINFSGKIAPSLAQLKQLQIAHLMNIPFENLDIHMEREIVLDYSAIYQKVIERRRGGFCYELNGLFYLLLERLGYEVKRVSARVRSDSGRLGQEADHMAIIVRLQNRNWLVDVGFGKFSFVPLIIELDKIQGDGKTEYKITQYNDQYLAVYSKMEGEWEVDEDGWRLGYLFTLKHREPDFFSAMCHYQQTSDESNFTKRRMITIPTKDGRVTLTDTKLKIDKEGKVEEIEVNDEKTFRDYLLAFFNLTVY